MRQSVLLAAVALLVLAPGARAQDAAPRVHAQRLSIAALGIPFALVSGEYERMTTPELSLGAAAGFFADDDDDGGDQSWLDAKVRYYPSARALRGFAIGALVGMARAQPTDCVSDDSTGACVYDGASATGAAVGVFLDYSWLLGRSDRFYVGTGLGAKRVLGLVGRTGDEYPEILSASRLQIGYSF
jgi:hypothetical protein